MRIFAGEKRIGHDSYEFMGTLYRNQMTLWLKGSPWYFYYVFIGVKLSLPIVAAFLVGLPLLFRKRLGDGRFFILFWLMYWFMPFTVLGGKFTRYFTIALPVVLITAAIGIHFIAHWLSGVVSRMMKNYSAAAFVRASVISLILVFPLVASASVTPFYRLYTNALGGGEQSAGNYFPHDEFYDARIREAVGVIAAQARPHAIVASESPGLVTYYGGISGRSDLVSVSLSDKEMMKRMGEGDFIIVARGRRYFSNEAIVSRLQEVSQPFATLSLGDVPAIKLYSLDKNSAAAIADTLK
jgi:hypothetical protein